MEETDVSPLNWPHLISPFDEALHVAVTDVLAHYDPIAIIAAGSILRGQAGPTSDNIDPYVLHHTPFRQRLQRRYHGVPFERFANPPLCASSAVQSADELDNARNIVDADPACAALILHRAVGHLIEYAFLARSQHLPRQKAMLPALDVLDSEAVATAHTS